MKFFVTGVGGQLGHDVMNELLKRGYEGVGSDIQENYSGVSDGYFRQPPAKSKVRKFIIAIASLIPGLS